MKLAADNVLIIHYETLLADPFSELSNINEFFGLLLSDEAIQAGIAAGNKTNMLAKADPERPPGEVHAHSTSVLDWFDDEDKRFFSYYCEKLLRYDFGYDYQVWN